MGSATVPTPAGFTALAVSTDGVSEGVLRHIHRGLVLGLDPVDGPGLGELALGLGLGHDEERVEDVLALDKLVEVALEHLQLEAEDVRCVGAAVNEQVRVDTMMDVTSVREWG
jgi:hypothetical protein